ncbi:MAG TPA: PAS domain-containing protein, partial [Thermoanaerobacterales bacterium]|nr:PAS domain-containing protein [Thermoanaerobacterales bacterium]
MSETWKKRLGFKNLNNEEIYLESLKMFHLEDVDRFPVPRGDSANEKRHRYSVEYKVKTIDSGYIWVLGQSKILYNKEGKPIKAYG